MMFNSCLELGCIPRKKKAEFSNDRFGINRTCFMEFLLATFGLLDRVRFTVQNYCGRKKCQVPPLTFGWRA